MNKALLLIIFFGMLCLHSSAQECSKIEKTVDDFKEQTNFDVKGLKHVSISAVQKNNQTKYYLSLKTTGATLNVAEKGVYIILVDGQKINKPDEVISAEFEQGHFFGSGDYEYSTLFRISPEEVKLLSEKPIRKYRLFIYDQELTDKQQKEQIELVGCLLKMTKN